MTVRGRPGSPQGATGKKTPGRLSRTSRARLVVNRGAIALLTRLLRRRPDVGADAGRPRITFMIANAYGVGGTTRTCLNLAGHLAADHDVEMLSLFRRRDEPQIPHPKGVTVTVVDDRRDLEHDGLLRRLLRRVPSVLMLPVDRQMADIVGSLYTDILMVRALWRIGEGTIIGTRSSLSQLAAAARRPGTIVIAQEHINRGSHTRPMQVELERIYRQVDVAVMLTSRDRDLWRRALGPDVRLAVIPNAIPDLPGPPAPLDSKVVLAAGRLNRQKGFDLLIKAFHEVVRARPEWQLRIAGNGPERPVLEQAIAERNLTWNITLLGQVQHVEREIAHASIFVMSSRFEGLPMVLIEAMSAGLPVVSFDCPTGPAEVIEHGRSGLLVPKADVGALAKTLITLIDDEDQRRALGAGALERSRHYAMSKVGPQWPALIAELRRS